jgi:hypothetical protein
MEEVIEMTFFDGFPRFYETTRAPAVRLNKRYQAIIHGNEDILIGKRVLDIASHDGRWSFAALKAGCSFVVGIEARRHFVDNANQTFALYGVDQSRYQFIHADAIEYLRRCSVVADTVLLLGFFYHVSCHVELASLIARTGARHIILDTGVISDRENPMAIPIIKLFEERTDEQKNAVGCMPTTLVGHPSREAIKMIFKHAGYSIREIDWMPILNQMGTDGVTEYQTGDRATFILERLT